MDQKKIKEHFENQAVNYDHQWKRLAPMRDGLYFLLDFILEPLPEEADILSVGSGTGSEVIYLAKKNPKWKFTAVEPAGAMISHFRSKAEEEGLSERIRFHEGYLNTLERGHKFDASTSFLVSQFILEENNRIEFFRTIASLLKPGGILVNSELSYEPDDAVNENIMPLWFSLMSEAGFSIDGLNKMRAAYKKDVAVVHPYKVEEILKSAGFKTPVRFYQAGLIHAWFSYL